MELKKSVPSQHCVGLSSYRDNGRTGNATESCVERGAGAQLWSGESLLCSDVHGLTRGPMLDTLPRASGLGAWELGSREDSAPTVWGSSEPISGEGGRPVPRGPSIRPYPQGHWQTTWGHRSHRAQGGDKTAKPTTSCKGASATKHAAHDLLMYFSVYSDFRIVVPEVLSK